MLFADGGLIAARHLLRSNTVSIPRLFAAALILSAALLPIPRQASGLTDEEKRQAFLKSHGDSSAEATPAVKKTAEKAEATSSPKPTKKKAKKSKPKPKPATKKKRPHPDSEEPTPRRSEPEPAKKPAPEPSRATVKPAPLPEKSVVVEKSGVVEEEPPPVPETEKSSWWWPFGHGTHYKYLTRSVRNAIDNAHVARSRWRYIVVHNSGTRQGNAKAFDYYHRHVRKMPNGLAYHFVIGNGTSSGNGEIEVGPRWVAQINGGHVHSDYLNSIALGICLVGDYNRDQPTRQQLEALDELIRYLRKRVGKTDHKLAIVKPHREINPPQWPTDCPGDDFPYNWLESHFGE